MAKKYKNMNKAELLALCDGRNIIRKNNPTKKWLIKAIENYDQLKAKPKIEQVKTEPELSETHVIEDEQANAPVLETDEANLDLPSPPQLSSVPVICSACKAIVDSATVEPCLICKGSLVFCPACAKAGTCHRCGKKLDPSED